LKILVTGGLGLVNKSKGFFGPVIFYTTDYVFDETFTSVILLSIQSGDVSHKL